MMVTAIDCQELLERLVIRMETEKESSVKEVEPSNLEAGLVEDIDGIENGDKYESGD